MEKLLNVREMAEKLNISAQKLRQMCRDKKIPHIRMGEETGAEIRFDESTIENWIRGKIASDSGFSMKESSDQHRSPGSK